MFMDNKLNQIRKTLYKELDKDRYYHTLGVMYTAASMAMCHGADLEKAMYAGLLHDCAKCISDNDKIRLCKKYHLNVTETERKNPGLLHAKLGAYLAKHKYKVSDQEILNAIASHTTGRPEMSLLEKIIYIADYMEPGRRKLPNMEVIRELAFKDIDQCLYQMLNDSLTYLERTNKAVDPATKQTYMYYKEFLEIHKEDKH